MVAPRIIMACTPSIPHKAAFQITVFMRRLPSGGRQPPQAWTAQSAALVLGSIGLVQARSRISCQVEVPNCPGSGSRATIRASEASRPDRLSPA